MIQPNAAVWVVSGALLLALSGKAKANGAPAAGGQQTAVEVHPEELLPEPR